MLLLGVALAVGTLLLRARGCEREQPAPGPLRSIPLTAASRAPTAAATAVPPPGGSPPRTRASVHDAIDRYVTAAALEARVTKADRRLLIQTIAQVRRSARRIRRAGVEKWLAEAHHRRVVLEANNLFRAKLGVTLDEFIATQGPLS